MTINQGETFHIGAFQNGWGQFVGCCTTLAVTAPNGAVTFPANDSYVTASQVGTYTLRVSCGSLQETATVSVTGTTQYDMRDYIFNDNQNQANMLHTSTNVDQVIRAYDIAPNRFYITKNWNGTGATEFEEFVWDQNYLYLVRDTSWQRENWCAGGDTSFELWTGSSNRGAWIPRYVVDNGVYTTGPFEVRARREGNGCGVCDSPTDSNGVQNVYRQVRVTKYPQYPFPNGRVLNDIIKLHVEFGPGQGENYYFSRTLGWVGYEDSTPMTSYYTGPANGGADFPVVAIDPCAGSTGCTWYQSQSPSVYHQIGRRDGYDWSATTSLDASGFLSYGPYATNWGSGLHNAQFYLMIDNRSADNGVVATIDVSTNSGQRVLARKDIRRQEFTAANSWQWFVLNFDNPSFEPVEVRTYWHDIAYIKHGGTYICH